MTVTVDGIIFVLLGCRDPLLCGESESRVYRLFEQLVFDKKFDIVFVGRGHDPAG